ncbi:MAG: NADH-quinone oxidoreductase subunit K [Actinomycetota bacterium]|nr:NADH-quinone oxidoreductase subunit K [Actinomycetota bacterium]
MILTHALVIGALFAAGTYLVLQRTLTRVVIGIAVLSHGANLLLLLAGGAPGSPPLVEVAPGSSPLDDATAATAQVSDPLPQALALTAIVITFGVTAFLLALSRRTWLLTHDDLVRDDLEDQRIAREGGDEEVA